MDEFNTKLKRFDGLNFVFNEPLKVNKSYDYTLYGNRYGWTSWYVS